MSETPRPLTAERIREILKAIPQTGSPLLKSGPLSRDYHRMMEIYGIIRAGGPEAARKRIEFWGGEAAWKSMKDKMPGKTEQMRKAMQAQFETTRKRLAAIRESEFEAVAACKDEIEAAIKKQR